MVSCDRQSRCLERELGVEQLLVGALGAAGPAQHRRRESIPASVGLAQQLDLAVQDLAEPDGLAVEQGHQRAGGHRSPE
jgi:hypothetical protein